MALASYDIGDVLRVKGVYTNISGIEVDPAVVRFSVKSPSGELTQYHYQEDPELVRASAGRYYIDLFFTESGAWKVRHYSTGAGQAAGEKTYFVRQSSFA